MTRWTLGLARCHDSFVNHFARLFGGDSLAETLGELIP